MRVSIGTDVKNAPNASNASPPNTSKMPPIIARIEIIVTPVGLLIDSVFLYANYIHPLLAIIIPVRIT